MSDKRIIRSCIVVAPLSAAPEVAKKLSSRQPQCQCGKLDIGHFIELYGLLSGSRSSTRNALDQIQLLCTEASPRRSTAVYEIKPSFAEKLATADPESTLTRCAAAQRLYRPSAPHFVEHSTRVLASLMEYARVAAATADALLIRVEYKFVEH